MIVCTVNLTRISLETYALNIHFEKCCLILRLSRPFLLNYQLSVMEKARMSDADDLLMFFL